MTSDTPWVATPVRLAFAAQLIRDGLYAAAATVLAECPGGAVVEALRRLCAVAAEHGRLAGELELAARHHRAAEEELRPALEDLLAGTVGVAAQPLPTTAPPPAPRPHVTPVDEDPAPATDDAAAAELEIRMLGPLRVRVGERWIERWGSLKARAIFQYLGYHRDRPVRRDQLMEVFWPGYAHGSARNNLNVALYNLRRTLSDDDVHQHVRYADGCYALNREVAIWSDHDRFLVLLESAAAERRAGRPENAVAQLESATVLYVGDLLEDDAMSEWHLPAQRHLADLHLGALEQLAELRLAAGDAAGAEEAARRAADTDPCRESAHRLLMRGYAAQGQLHLVSRQLRLCVATLRRELGTAPSAETIQLAHELTAAVATPRLA